ncbi:hypothetical protein L611_001500000860 [Aminobacter sp. J15]|nr:hypothetical protein L611_001500000860 [Aminobacter sp. J15]
MDEKTLEAAAAHAVTEEALEAIVERGHYLDHLKKVNDVYYDQIKIADQKAAYLFTFMVAFLVASAEGRDVFSAARYAQGSWHTIVLSACMALAVVTTIFAAVLVVLPRKATGGTTLYWGGLVRQPPALHRGRPHRRPAVPDARISRQCRRSGFHRPAQVHVRRHRLPRPATRHPRLCPAARDEVRCLTASGAAVLPGHPAPPLRRRRQSRRGP